VFIGFSFCFPSARKRFSRSSHREYSLTANHPAGPPDPQRLDQIWQVDPITGSLHRNNPIYEYARRRAWAKIPFALKYNSSATLTLQQMELDVFGNGGEYPTAVAKRARKREWLCLDASAPMRRDRANSSNIPMATPGLNGSMGPAGPWTTTGRF